MVFTGEKLQCDMTGPLVQPYRAASMTVDSVVLSSICCMYSLVKVVTILYEFIQFLSGIFNHILMELNSMVHTKWPLKKHNTAGAIIK